MSSARIESSGAGRYRVTGELTFATVRDLLRTTQSLFANESALEVDFASISAADSAGLALLIEWYRNAVQAKKSLRFVAVPTQLQALAKISEVEWLLEPAASANAG